MLPPMLAVMLPPLPPPPALPPMLINPLAEPPSPPPPPVDTTLTPTDEVPAVLIWPVCTSWIVPPLELALLGVLPPSETNP